MEVPHELGDAYFGVMGIQLDEFDVRVINHLARMKEAGQPHQPYLFGLLFTSVDLFLSGKSEQRDLETIYSIVKLMDRLCKVHSHGELREIACGTREISGEDVPSGQ